MDNACAEERRMQEASCLGAPGFDLNSHVGSSKSGAEIAHKLRLA